MAKRAVDNFDMFEPDENNLVHESRIQPKLVIKYTTQLADARRAFDQEKARLDVVRAEIDARIRSYPSKYGLDKVTESAISNLIIRSKKFQKQQETIIKAKHDQDTIQGWVTALEHRKKSIENMVSLHGQSYFSTPKVSTEHRDLVDKEAENEVRRRTLKRRKKDRS